MEDNLLKNILHLLACPDDGADLTYRDNVLSCNDCRRTFSIMDKGFIEMLPSQPRTCASRLPKELAYFEEYRKCYEESFRWMQYPIAWGIIDGEDLASLSAVDEGPASSRFRSNAFQSVRYRSFIKYRSRQIKYVTQLIRGGNEVACDISGGAGNYTLQLAKLFKTIIHCDLDVENLNYVYRRLARLSVDNVYLVRSDYFYPPFRRGVIDAVLCMDTLIRGPYHDKELLSNLLYITKAGGYIYCDFHNPWHNPANIILKRGFSSQNQSYSLRELKMLLKRLNVDHYKIFPFVQEFEPGTQVFDWAQKVLPSSFNIVKIRRS
jgi:ubiquinone/menaquinone biosynthesis C-methylase UbiE/uncharacterized protein YbaR (Trm112 family)